jgi:hypothetical protein
MTAETTEPTSLPAAPPPAAAPRRIGLRVALAAIALIELIDGMSNAPILMTNMRDVPGPGIGSAIVKMQLAAHPVLALSALMFAAIGYVRHAIPALGAVVVMTWLNFMPSVVLHGLDFAGPFALVQTSTQIFAFPLMSACAIALAARDRRPRLATALVSTPTPCSARWRFFVALMIHGF